MAEIRPKSDKVTTPTIAYIANQFPSPVEPYVWEEIGELRRRGIGVIAGSGRKVDFRSLPERLQEFADETIYLQPLRAWGLLRAVGLCLRRVVVLSDILLRVLVLGKEPVRQRLRALLHTWLGAYYALLIARDDLVHVHAHHGYFASWVAMVAARLLGVSFSFTLHGSDLLQHPAYLDLKLANCIACFTVSEYNRQYLLQNYAGIPAEKVVLQRMGVKVPEQRVPLERAHGTEACMLLLAVGRLHPVKNHAFLVRCCARLKKNAIRFLCLIAGEGPERETLQHLVAELGLEPEVKLLGHVDSEQLDFYYMMADVVVLTSRSEGLPLVLMEAMAREKLVLAPAITRIPELVVDGETGFLFQGGSEDDFVHHLELIRTLSPWLAGIQRVARERVLDDFEQTKNLRVFSDRLLGRIASPTWEDASHESPVLQQI